MLFPVDFLSPKHNDNERNTEAVMAANKHCANAQDQGSEGKKTAQFGKKRKIEEWKHFLKTAKYAPVNG